MNSKYTAPQERVVTSITLEQDVREWIDNNIPKQKRSDFINKLARRYIKRYEAANSSTEQKAQVTA